jgi:hypothetical protein
VSMATQYTINYNGWESCFEEFGDDIVFFSGIVRHIDKPDKPFPILLSFKMIQKQAEEMFPGAADIIKQAKKHLKGWGPQESVLVREMEELGIDLEAVVLKIITTQINLDAEFQRIIALDTNVDKISDILEDLEQTVSDIKSETITYYSLCERFEKLITDEVVDRYPILLNSSSDCILQLQTILTHHIPSLVNDLTSLINEAKQES